MSRFFSKLLISILAAFVLFASITPAAMAQSTTTTSGPWYNQNYSQWSAKVFGGDQNEIFGERYTYAQVNWIINSLTAVIIGQNISNCIGQYSTGNLAAVGGCMKNFNIATSAPEGAIPGLAFLTGSIISTRPASGIEYVKETASKLHVIPQAYAQSTGAGFNTLQPIQALWTVVRDISYALMVIVIIVMAFMIMFRVKISPQIIVTVQSALPRVVIALILITFSYAIAGFLVDLMYVIVALFAGMIKIGGDKIVHSDTTVQYLFTQLTSGNGITSIVIGIIIFGILLFALGAIVAGSSTVSIAAFPALAPISIAGIIGGVLILLFGAILFMILFRLLWLMIRTAATTVLLIIVGPLMILMGTLSDSGGFWSWFRNLAANLAVYPTVIVMIFLSHYFFWGWFVGGFLTGALAAFTPFNTFNINVWNLGSSSQQALIGADSAPIVNLPGMPIRTNVLGFFLSFVILFLIPRAAHIIEALIEGKKVDVGGAVGEALRPITGPASFVQGAVLGGAGTYFGTLVKLGLENRLGTKTETQTGTEQAKERAGNPPTS